MAKDANDRKRKKLLEEKKRKARENGALAYKGNMYKKARFTPAWFHAEIAIYDSYQLTQYKVSDETAASAIESLIMQLRGGELPALPDVFLYEEGREEDLLIENIRRRWDNLFAGSWKPSDVDLIGVLRSILGTIETMKTPGPQSFGYIRYIAEFLTKKAGVSFQTSPEDATAWLDEDEEEDELRPVLVESRADEHVS